jgi:hypothetical protein
MKNTEVSSLFFPYPFVDDQKIKVVFESQISLLIAKMIDCTFLGFINAGEIIKVETFVGEFLFVHLGFLSNIQILQNAVVLSQDAVYITHQICYVAVQSIVVSIATHVGTEFFVDAAAEFFTTVQAFTLFSHGF